MQGELLKIEGIDTVKLQEPINRCAADMANEQGRERVLLRRPTPL